MLKKIEEDLKKDNKIRQLKKMNNRIVSRVNANLSKFNFDTERFVTHSLEFEKMLKFYAFYGITSHHPLYFHFNNSNISGSYFLGKCYVRRSTIYKSDIRGDELKRRGDQSHGAMNIPLVEDEMIIIRGKKKIGENVFISQKAFLKNAVMNEDESLVKLRSYFKKRTL